MRILSAKQHFALDEATMRQEDISNLDLMERAATAWASRFTELYPDKHRRVMVLAGSGNNGGDGLVVARLLRFEAFSVNVIVAAVGTPSADNKTNQRRARDTGVPLRHLNEGDPLPVYTPGTIVVDALFGTGLSRAISGYWGEVITHLNDQAVTRVALDLPSGLATDSPSRGPIVRAHRTLSLGYPKLSLFAPENTHYLGSWELVPFAVADAFVDQLPGQQFMLTDCFVAGKLANRHANDHKGTFGHALLVAGAFGKMGAAVISARAVLRAGAGLVTTHIPRSGYEIMQISFPEAMCSIDAHRYHFTGIEEDLARFQTVGVGPGLGTDESTEKGVVSLIDGFDKPMVIDADALNILAKEPARLDNLPKGSILTPHPKEFERLFGKTDNDFARWVLQRERAQALGLVIILKTGYTSIAIPDGRMFFNTTGNPGMGTGGTGDALTGVLTGLLAQGYTPPDAACLGVFLHGLAGDLAAEELGQESLIAEDVVSHLGQAFQTLHAATDHS